MQTTLQNAQEEKPSMLAMFTKHCKFWNWMIYYWIKSNLQFKVNNFKLLADIYLAFQSQNREKRQEYRKRKDLHQEGERFEMDVDHEFSDAIDDETLDESLEMPQKRLAEHVEDAAKKFKTPQHDS